MMNQNSSFFGQRKEKGKKIELGFEDPQDGLDIGEIMESQTKGFVSPFRETKIENNIESFLQGKNGGHHEIPLSDGKKAFFPYEAYDQQKEFIGMVYDSLLNDDSALIESPTGTGKTISMLTGCLAFLENNSINKKGKKIKLIYTSRTHSQLKQVVRELRKTKYKTSMTIMGSRDQLCINKSLEQLRGEALNTECHRIKKQCTFYQKSGQKNESTLELSIKAGKHYDIEDLVKKGKSMNCCPYYSTRDASKTVQIVLMPYNYITDMWMIDDYKEMLNGSIVVIDEAHNIAQVAESGSSFSLTLVHLNEALKETEDFRQLKMRGKTKKMVCTGTDFEIIYSIILYLQNKFQQKLVDVRKWKSINKNQLSQDVYDPENIFRFVFDGHDYSDSSEQTNTNDKKDYLQLLPRNLTSVVSKMGMFNEDIDNLKQQDGKFSYLDFSNSARIISGESGY